MKLNPKSTEQEINQAIIEGKVFIGGKEGNWLELRDPMGNFLVLENDGSLIYERNYNDDTEINDDTIISLSLKTLLNPMLEFAKDSENDFYVGISEQEVPYIIFPCKESSTNYLRLDGNGDNYTVEAEPKELKEFRKVRSFKEALRKFSSYLK